MTNGSGVSRGDRNRNERLDPLRSAVPVTNGIVGIDLADQKQMVVVCDHDSRVLARRTFRCKARPHDLQGLLRGREFGFQFADPSLRRRQLCHLRCGQTFLLAAIDAVLPAPVVDRLIRQLQITCHVDDLATLRQQIKNLAAELGGIATTGHNVLLLFAAQDPTNSDTDITEHPTREGKVYCAVVLDTYSRRVVGWSIDASPTAALVTNALGMAIDNRRSVTGTVIHSDQGVQGGSWAFTERAKASGLVPSMGSIGDCYDNGLMESFWSRMQVELLTDAWRTRIELANAIFDYLEIFHNRQRRHSALGYLTPIQFENQTTPVA